MGEERRDGHECADGGGFVRALRDRVHGRVRATGSVLLPAVGYDHVPGALAGTLAGRQGGDAVRAIDIGCVATGPLLHGLSQGIRATVRDGLTLPSARGGMARPWSSTGSYQAVAGPRPGGWPGPLPEPATAVPSAREIARLAVRSAMREAI